MNYSAVIIAGGKGTRLSHLTKEIPKPMIEIGGKPIIEHQIEEFSKNGITDIIITVSHLKEVIINYLGNGEKYGLSIRYIEEPELLGTCGAFYLLKELIKKDFLVAYGDVLFSLDLNRFVKFHEEKDALITLVSHPNSHPYDSDLIVENDDNQVVAINGKKTDRTGILYNNLVNAGFYCMKNSVLDYFDSLKNMDLEKDLVMNLLLTEGVYSYRTSEYIKDMGTGKRLDEVNESYKSGIVSKRNLLNLQKCIFLDRDGTINKKKDLLYNLDDFELEMNVSEAIRKINNSGYLCVVITNQPVIARNLCSLDELNKIHMKMEMLLGEDGAYLDDIFFCPHHPDSGYPEERREYKIKCQCRKPNIGMIEFAAKKYSIDLNQSYMIGDTTTDIQTAKNAGLKSILLKTGDAGEDGKYSSIADYEFNDLLGAVNEIL